MLDRGVKSDEQLAQRAMGLQKPGTRRINIHARTINNWRNGRSKPRSLEDQRLSLVLEALALSPEELDRLAAAFSSSKAVENSRRPRFSGLRSGNPFLVAVAVLAVLALTVAIALFTYRLGTTGTAYLAEIPPDQLQLSSTGFVLPGSDKEVLREEQLERLSGWELYVARNEIFARHGRPFVEPSSQCLQRHFDRWKRSAESLTGWYVKRSGSPLVSDLEYKNAAIIRDYECRVRGGQYTCNGMLNPCG